MQIYLLFSLLCCSFVSTAASFSLTSANQRWQLDVMVSDADFSAAKQQQLQSQFVMLTQALYQLYPDISATSVPHKETAGTKALQLWQQAGQLCENWWQQQHVFHCRTALARASWQQAVAKQQLPDRVSLRQQQRLMLATQPGPEAQQLQWDLQALLEAIVLDELATFSQQLWPQARTLRLQLGQNLRFLGLERSEIQLPFLQQQLELGTLLLQQQALVYANTTAPIKIGPRFYSSLLQPKDGWPVEYGPAVAVVANSASEAWLLAQTLVLLPATERQLFSEKWRINALWQTKTDSAITAQTQVTEGWYLLLKNAKNYRSHHHLSLQLELPAQGNNAKPPYLAVWLSKKGETQPRAQLALWGEQPRWYQELRSWWRQFGLQHQEQLQHWAGATRRAGLYQLRWNGRDLQGLPLVSGDYILYLEVAREGGGREKLSLPLHWPEPQSTQHQQGKLQGKHEFGQISWQLHSEIPQDNTDQRADLPATVQNHKSTIQRPEVAVSG